MNINLVKISENPSYNLLYENMTAHSFMPLITLPTRLSNTCDTLSDNIHILLDSILSTFILSINN